MKKYISELSRYDKILELICCAILLGMFSATIISYGNLPEIIPTHYNAQGVVDDYGSKYHIFLLPFISLVLYIAMTFSSLLSSVKSTNSIKLLRYVKLVALLVIAFLLLKTLAIALTETTI